jgi:hypothetical protein
MSYNKEKTTMKRTTLVALVATLVAAFILPATAFAQDEEEATPNTLFSDAAVLGYNKSSQQKADYFKRLQENLADALKKADITDAVQTSEKAFRQLAPVELAKLNAAYTTHLAQFGCDPSQTTEGDVIGKKADGSRYTYKGQLQSTACQDYLKQVETDVKALIAQIKDPDLKAVADSIYQMAPDLYNVQTGTSDFALIRQMAIFALPPSIVDFLTAGENYHNHTETPADKAQDMAGSSVIVLRSDGLPVEGVIEEGSTADSLSVKTPDGEVVDVPTEDARIFVNENGGAGDKFGVIKEACDTDGKFAGQDCLDAGKDGEFGPDDMKGLEGKDACVYFKEESEKDACGVIGDIDDEGFSVGSARVTYDELNNDEAVVVLGNVGGNGTGTTVNSRFTLGALGLMGLPLQSPDATEGVWHGGAQVTFGWRPSSATGLAVNGALGACRYQGHTTFGTEEGDDSRWTPCGSLGLSLPLSSGKVRPEPFANVTFTGGGIGGEAGIDAVWSPSERFDVRAGGFVGYTTSSIVPDSRPGRESPTLDYPTVGFRLGFDVGFGRY